MSSTLNELGNPGNNLDPTATVEKEDTHLSHPLDRGQSRPKTFRQ